MATGSQHDTRLNINVGVNGEQEVQDLSKDLRDLAAAGGEGAPKLQQLADSLDASQAATARMRTAERQLAAEYSKARADLQGRVDALRRTSIETDAATKKTDAYKAAQQAERLAIHEASIELREKRDALAAASKSAQQAAAAEKELVTQARSLVKETAAARDGVQGLGKVASDAAGELGRLAPLLASAFSAQQIVTLIAQQQQLALSYQAIFGSAQQAGAEMQFVRDAANRLGVESTVLARSYQSLAAATKGTMLEGRQTRDVFEAVARAMSMLGKSSAETEQALTAISQMASKGTVSMEELRGQLGEALPGAMQAAARGAGITVEALTAMVESGSLLAKDLLPDLTKGLNELYANAAPPQTIISAWARFKNTVADTANAIGEGGAATAITKGLSAITIGTRGLSNWTDVAGTAIGEFIAKVQTGNFELGTAAALYEKYDAELRKAAEAAGLVAAAQDAATQATQAQARAVDNAIAAQQRQAESSLAVRARYTELAKGAADYTTAMDKAAKARDAEAGVLTSLVAIYGTEQERRQAATEAAAMQARATRDLATAKDAEAIIATSYLIRLQEEALQRNDTTKATQDQIRAAQQSADVKRAEADQALATAHTRAIEVEAAKAAAAAYQDNSARVYEFRGAAEQARQEVERLTAAQRLGKATDEEVAAARARAATATVLYRDALKDAAAAAERRVQAEQLAGRTVQTAISLDQERAQAALEVAQAQGDAKAAAEAQTAVTQAQARAADEAAASARREALAIREAADAAEREAQATGTLTAEKRASIDASRKSADMKEIEAQRSEVLAGKIRALANSERDRLDGLEREISLQERRNQLEERRQALEDKRLGRDKLGFSTDKAGNTVNAGGELTTLTGIYNFLKAAGVNDDTAAKKLAREFADPTGRVSFYGSPGQRKYGGSTISQALQKAAEAYMFDPGNSTTPAAPSASGGSTTHMVSITLPDGTTGAVNAATANDAENLSKLLSRLGSARRVG